jgi:hypothetical protein
MNTSTITPQGKMVTGLFNDRASAERAYESLQARGYGRDDVNLVMSDDIRKAQCGTTQGATTELGTKAAEGAGVGGAAGGVVGALVGWGIPEERVQRYEAGIKNGGILIGVRSRSDDDATFFAEEWKKNHAADVHA